VKNKGIKLEGNMKRKHISKILAIFLVTVVGLVWTIKTVRAGDGYTATKTFSLTVAPALSITTASPLTVAVAGQAYSITFGASGGIPPYTWSVASGSTLPAGLTLTSAGILSGTPTTAGTYTFDITVTDSVGGTARASVKPAK
jgi:hypothetical protein